jgi:hypothetical protein
MILRNEINTQQVRSSSTSIRTRACRKHGAGQNKAAGITKRPEVDSIRPEPKAFLDVLGLFLSGTVGL